MLSALRRRARTSPTSATRDDHRAACRAVHRCSASARCTLSAVLVFMGAAGKSAMFPLHIWLPDAMEGPTPVSALIHAATMVVAGVYLVARLFPLFAATDERHDGRDGRRRVHVAVRGRDRLTQYDIKRVLAFSTLCQLGYMMLALGVARMDHPLGLHRLACSTCHPRLLQGAAVPGRRQRDPRRAQQRHPRDGRAAAEDADHPRTFLIACLAIAGVPAFSGFFSKDEILAAALHGGHPVVFGVALLVAGLTAFYMFRLYFMTFWGEAAATTTATTTRTSRRRACGAAGDPRGAVACSSVSCPSAASSYRGELEHARHRLAIAIPATLAACGIGLVGAALRAAEHGAPDRVAARSAGSTARSTTKFYFDEIYLFVTHQVIFRLSAGRSPGSTGASWTAPWT